MNQLDELKQSIAAYKKVAIAYSGGCDSNFLLAICNEVLGKENVLPIFVKGCMVPNRDQECALDQMKAQDHLVLDMDVFSIPDFQHNTRDRCYSCKKKIMADVLEESEKRGFFVVLDGQNQDDQKEFRPGQKACQELGIVSPLSRLSKKEIRSYSKQYGLTSASRPANACLASRFDYGRLLDPALLKKVESGEDLLHQAEIEDVRLRDHGELARIETDLKNIERLIMEPKLIQAIKALGYRYVTFDLEGLKKGGYDRG
ncbi:ATP-dependent sacrificial sulfur transferase LarE [Dubosiella newyorkensis]|uniref:ATP-dependent sacrificial sulfur transferase LarE n=1 Tax=Dubosiella newyorkensis TaxID=1862672 RepID=UPI0024BB1060|nr:ATP-dependent sacrificial sulfur transferase LarE [Dubosiella newyorkensis]